MPTTLESPALRAMTTDIVAAYLSKNHLPPCDVPGLVTTVHGALVSLASGIPAPGAEPAPEPLTPAEIRKSIRPDGLISFLDGKAYKTLRRHLTVHGLDPESYRAKFGLPVDYPMVAANYSARRSQLAKELGLGVAHRQAAE